MGLRGRRESDEHREFEDMAVAHVVGGLTVDQGRMFRSHLLECTACRARVGELRAIAHDLADVERDERRIRTAKRTETKAHEDEPDASTSTTPRLSGRATLLVAASLALLIALSVWNYALRGRLQQTEQELSRLRESVQVLQDGQEWETVQTYESSTVDGVDGQVRTLDNTMVIMVDGLIERPYVIYLLRSNDQTSHHIKVEATNSMVYQYIGNHDVAVESADRVLLIRTDEPTSNPDLTGLVFEARRPDANGHIGTQPVVTPSN
jgi:hypothetical protein